MDKPDSQEAIGEMARTFEVAGEEAPRGPSKLLVGLVGASASGKTFSALRIATGIQKVTGTPIALVDTEGRGEDYKSYFKYSVVKFPPPYGPLDYVDAMKQAMGIGGPDTIIIVDSCSHEHSGEGGRMWQSRTYIEEHIARERKNNPERFDTDWKVEARAKQLFQASLIKPSAERAVMNEFVRQKVRLGIFCWRAKDVVKQIKDSKGKTEVIDFGWQHETTSTLMYEMKVQFMLPPFSEGVPDLSPAKPGEAAYVKRPKQFRGAEYLKPGEALSESLGEALARWAAGDGPKAPSPGPTPASLLDQAVAELRTRFPDPLAVSDRKEFSVANFDVLPGKLHTLTDTQLRAGLDKIHAAFPAREPGEDSE